MNKWWPHGGTDYPKPHQSLKGWGGIEGFWDIEGYGGIDGKGWLYGVKTGVNGH